MTIPFKTAAFAAALGALGASSAPAAEILVNSNITVPTIWTADNVYNLQAQIYVTPGATLTIRAGTVVASTPNTNVGLAVCKGAQIFVEGTAQNPVIMTSTADTATWTGGNPKTGTWRATAKEWGNLTIMGGGYISENAAALGNSATPAPTNLADMEGLTAGPSTDRYGGGNDDDDSGTITYLSLRYGGRNILPNVELNGLSLGGIGRATDISFVEVMNNIDDGIEIWGGTVNLKNFSIWNVGDDSFDVDQGWRGKAQFGLIVQGYSFDGIQGGGVGDNAFETDGAENSDWQPVTTSTIYNCTVIGQPGSTGGDHGTAWRDNARVQYRNCLFMDLGGRLVSFDNLDGDGAQGYGHNGTLSWANTWTTAYTATSTVNAPGDPSLFYTVQSSGNLAEIRDSVFFRNQAGDAYTEATNRGVMMPATDNVLIVGAADVDAPIQKLVRGPNVPLQLGTLNISPVTKLDPRPKNQATSSVAAAPADGFFTSAAYRGAFEPSVNPSWLCGWTASYAYGLTPEEDIGTPYCFGDGSGTACPCGNNSAPGSQAGCLNSIALAGKLTAKGCPSVSGDSFTLLSSGLINTGVLHFQGTVQQNGGAGITFGDGLRCVTGSIRRFKTKVAAGNVCQYPKDPGDPLISVAGIVPAGATRHYQAWYRNNAAAFCPVPMGDLFNLTNGLTVVWLP